MNRLLIGYVWAVAALAQSGDPLQVEVQAVADARAQGRFAEAAAHREAARRLLDAAPRADRVKAVAELYSQAGRAAEARSVLLHALEAQPRSLDLLLLAADSWHEERNVLEETAYVERASAAAGDVCCEITGRLAELYRQLGRAPAFGGAVERLRAHEGTPGAAEALEDLGFFDEAAAQYRRRAEAAPDARQAAAAWRLAAQLARRRHRDAEAEAADRAAAQWVAAEPGDSVSCGFSVLARRSTLGLAREAARAGRTDDAFVLGLEAIGEANPDQRAGTLFSEVPILAAMLADRGARGMADQLWERLLVLAGEQSADSLVPLAQAARAHARYLSGFADRAPSARAALERYRDLLVTAHGARSGELADALRLSIEFEQDHGEPERAAVAAEELLALEETLNGPDGAGNLRALRIAAGLYRIQNQPRRAAALEERARIIAENNPDAR